MGRCVEIGPGQVLHVQDEGAADAPAVMWFHALGTDSSIWQHQFASLADRYRLIAIDAPGHGGSPPWPSLTQQSLAQSVWQLADRLGLGQVSLVGTSMGAVVALQAAALQPDRVHKLVLCAATLVRPEAMGADLRARSAAAQADDMHALALVMGRRWFPDGTDASPGVRQAIEALVRNTRAQGYADCARVFSTYDLSAALSVLQSRVLLVAGDHDAEVPEHFACLVRQYPLARLLVLPGVGHFPANESPQRFAQAVQEHLALPATDRPLHLQSAAGGVSSVG